MASDRIQWVGADRMPAFYHGTYSGQVLYTYGAPGWTHAQIQSITKSGTVVAIGHDTRNSGNDNNFRVVRGQLYMTYPSIGKRMPITNFKVENTEIDNNNSQPFYGTKWMRFYRLYIPKGKVADVYDASNKLIASVEGRDELGGIGFDDNVIKVASSFIIRNVSTEPPTTTPPPGPSQEELDRLIKEYEQKMAELRQQMEAEKQALAEGNAAAVQQAQVAQQSLMTQLATLKQAYDQLTVQNTTAQTTLQQMQQQLADTKTEYDQKMQEFQAAKQKEVDAISSRNAEAIAKAKAEQTTIIGELTTLKTTYDTLVARMARCPVIPEGTVLVDGGSGQMFRFENGQLRPMSTETYRALGSPSYTTFPQGTLTNCARGSPIIAEVPTSAPTTPAPTRVPQFDGTLFVVVHGASWNRDGQLRVLSSRFGGLAIEPFEFKSLDQTWLINQAGYVRSVTGKGPYVTTSPDCMAPILDEDPPSGGWRVLRTGQSAAGYRLIAPCGSRLVSPGRDVGLDKSGSDQEDWFIVRVGRAQV